MKRIKDMTPEVCYLECSNLGHRYYGLKNGDECHCGSNPNFHGKFTGFQVSNDACNIPCPGNKSKKCGGETTLSFYTKSKTFGFREWSETLLSFPFYGLWTLKFEQNSSDFFVKYSMI